MSAKIMLEMCNYAVAFGVNKQRKFYFSFQFCLDFGCRYVDIL